MCSPAGRVAGAFPLTALFSLTHTRIRRRSLPAGGHPAQGHEGGVKRGGRKEQRGELLQKKKQVPLPGFSLSLFLFSSLSPLSIPPHPLHQVVHTLQGRTCGVRDGEREREAVRERPRLGEKGEGFFFSLSFSSRSPTTAIVSRDTTPSRTANHLVAVAPGTVRRGAPG